MYTEQCIVSINRTTLTIHFWPVLDIFRFYSLFWPISFWIVWRFFTRFTIVWAHMWSFHGRFWNQLWIRIVNMCAFHRFWTSPVVAFMLSWHFLNALTFDVARNFSIIIKRSQFQTERKNLRYFFEKVWVRIFCKFMKCILSAMHLLEAFWLYNWLHVMICTSVQMQSRYFCHFINFALQEKTCLLYILQYYFTLNISNCIPSYAVSKYSWANCPTDRWR